jgi:hypothetical protein
VAWGVHEGADREREVVLVEAGEGVTEVDWQPGGQAGCEAEDPAFAVLTELTAGT